VSALNLQFLLKGSESVEKAFQGRKRNKNWFHLLEFEFKGENVIGGFVGFDPAFVRVELCDEFHHYRIFDYLAKRTGQDSQDVIARIVSETIPETLYHSEALERAIAKCWPSVKLKCAERRDLSRVRPGIAGQVNDCLDLARELKSASIPGEKLVKYVLNEQGMLFPLVLYSHLQKRGLRFANMTHQYADPRGVWKGVLLREGYSPYRICSEIIYFDNKIRVPADNAVKIKPF